MDEQEKRPKPEEHREDETLKVSRNRLGVRSCLLPRALSSHSGRCCRPT
jgi:hypothetical protein